LDPESDFQHLLIEYLENTHVSEFLTGSKEEVLHKLSKDATKPDYIDPCDVLPVPPPEQCKKEKCGSCTSCKEVSTWWSTFKSTINEILALSNTHTCFSTVKKDGSRKRRKPFLRCLDKLGQPLNYLLKA